MDVHMSVCLMSVHPSVRLFVSVSKQLFKYFHSFFFIQPQKVIFQNLLCKFSRCVNLIMLHVGKIIMHFVINYLHVDKIKNNLHSMILKQATMFSLFQVDHIFLACQNLHMLVDLIDEKKYNFHQIPFTFKEIMISIEPSLYQYFNNAI